MKSGELAARVRVRLPDALEARGEVTVTVPPADLLDALSYLREEPDLSFGFLSDVSATDWPGVSPRFWVAYHLLSIEHTHRLRVKVGLPPQPDPPHVASVASLYPTANWLKREMFDFFSVIFDGHPNLRQIEIPKE